MSFLTKMYPGDAAMLLLAVVAVQITLVVGVAWLAAHLRARRLPALRHAIWMGALCVAVLTPFISWVATRMGLATWTLPRSRASNVAALPPHGKYELQSMPPTNEAAGESAVSAANTEPRSQNSNNDHAARAVEAGHSWPTPIEVFRTCGGALAAVWIIGLIVQAIRLLRGWLWIVRERRRAEPVIAPWAHDLLADVVRQLGLQRIPALAIRPVGGSPLVTGVWRPIILLPPQWLDKNNRNALRQVLLHESAHVARHDVLIGLVQRFAAAVFWPHPLVHVLNRELSRAREETCDNYVLAAVEPTAFSATLLAFAGEPEALWPQPGIGLRSGPWRLEDRVAGLLHADRSHATRIGAKTAATWAIVAAVLVTVMACAGPTLPEDESAATTEAADDTEAKPVASPSPFTDFIVDENDPHAELLKLGARLRTDDTPRLVALDLSHTAVTDADLAQLKNWPHIEELSLAHTNVTDAGMTHVQHLKKLVVLDLSHTCVTQKGLAYTQYLDHLQSIGLEGTGIDRLNQWEFEPPDDLIEAERENELPNPFDGGGQGGFGSGGGGFGGGVGGEGGGGFGSGTEEDKSESKGNRKFEGGFF